MHASRPLVTLLSVALLPPLLGTALLGGTAAAQGDATPPSERHTAQWCENRPVGFAPFTDVVRPPLREHSECLNRAGVVQGGPEGRPATEYGPALVVRRGAMAAFLARALDAADRLDLGTMIRALPPGEAAFDDVPRDSVHAMSVDRLAAAGIVQGGVGGLPTSSYSPDLVVTRAQMATFINRSIAYALGQDPSLAGRGTGYSTTVDYFTDDAAAGVHEASINGITSQGIAVGDGAHLYSPTQPIDRGQMAAFLTRALTSLYDRDDSGVRRIRRMDAPGGAWAVRLPDDQARIVEPGRTVRAEVTSASPIRSVELSGPPVPPGVRVELDPAGHSANLSFTVRQDAALGQSHLSFVTTFADGSQDVDTMRVVVGRPL